MKELYKDSFHIHLMNEQLIFRDSSLAKDSHHPDLLTFTKGTKSEKRKLVILRYLMRSKKGRSDSRYLKHEESLMSTFREDLESYMQMK